MRSDIQKLKAYNLFLAFDVEKNGYLDRADLDRLAGQLTENQGRAVGSPLHTELLARLMTYWNQMVESLDNNKDNRISADEFLKFADKIMKNPQGPEGQSILALCDVIFTMADQDGSGALSLKEFTQCIRAYGGTDTAAASAFWMMDRDKNGRISREEFQIFMRDVFQSRALNDASALAFGPGSRK